MVRPGSLADPPFVLTAHAATALSERDIEIAWVEQVLRQPVRIEPDREDATLRHALGRIAEWANRVLRVVYNETVEPRRAVTVYFDRTLRNEP
jgi:hypothetical protein